jgi:hypothetical protein
MVVFTFNEPEARDFYEDRIRKLWSQVVTAPTPDLWVKVFFYPDKVSYWRMTDNNETLVASRYFKSLDGVERQHVYELSRAKGSYRCIQYGGHGMTNAEWGFIQRHKNKIKHIITLRFGLTSSLDHMASLMAHEYRHYRQWKKYGAYNMNYKLNGTGKRPIQVERDANKWMRKRMKELGYRSW